MITPEQLKDMPLEELLSQIRYHNTKYWVEASPEITDEEYDLLIRQLEKLAPGHELLTAVHAPLVASEGTVIHQEPMLSL
ncbi:MAG: NAD-dependent DNA ligase LigA, partial [Lentisphaeria bacterium]|nr:NAD-dependent DNA ligase LigA [Lentisphaeria bacterium]